MQKLEGHVIEYIHDEMVPALLAFDEEVRADESRSNHLIESAAARPFHTIGGVDLWPAPSQKAAALFHALTCNHCFVNGNKRTAVLALDLFLAMNGHLLLLSSEEVYQLARHTARANEQQRNLDDFMAELALTIERSTLDIEVLELEEVRERLGENTDERLAQALQALRVVHVLAPKLRSR
jgi:death-on-curing protein